MRQVERHNLLQQPSPALQAVLLALHGCQALRELRHLLLILPHALLLPLPEALLSQCAFIQRLLAPSLLRQLQIIRLARLPATA